MFGAAPNKKTRGPATKGFTDAKKSNSNAKQTQKRRPRNRSNGRNDTLGYLFVMLCGFGYFANMMLKDVTNYVILGFVVFALIRYVGGIAATWVMAPIQHMVPTVNTNGVQENLQDELQRDAQQAQQEQQTEQQLAEDPQEEPEYFQSEWQDSANTQSQWQEKQDEWQQWQEFQRQQQQREQRQQTQSQLQRPQQQNQLAESVNSQFPNYDQRFIPAPETTADPNESVVALVPTNSASKKKKNALSRLFRGNA